MNKLLIRLRWINDYTGWIIFLVALEVLWIFAGCSAPPKATMAAPRAIVSDLEPLQHDGKTTYSIRDVRNPDHEDWVRAWAKTIH